MSTENEDPRADRAQEPQEPAETAISSSDEPEEGAGAEGAGANPEAGAAPAAAAAPETMAIPARTVAAMKRAPGFRGRSGAEIQAATATPAALSAAAPAAVHPPPPRQGCVACGAPADAWRFHKIDRRKDPPRAVWQCPCGSRRGVKWPDAPPEQVVAERAFEAARTQGACVDEAEVDATREALELEARVAAAEQVVLLDGSLPRNGEPKVEVRTSVGNESATLAPGVVPARVVVDPDTGPRLEIDEKLTPGYHKAVVTTIEDEEDELSDADLLRVVADSLESSADPIHRAAVARFYDLAEYLEAEAAPTPASADERSLEELCNKLGDILGCRAGEDVVTAARRVAAAASKLPDLGAAEAMAHWLENAKEHQAGNPFSAAVLRWMKAVARRFNALEGREEE